MITFIHPLIIPVICCAIAMGQTSIHDPELDYINTSESICAEFGIVKNDEVLRLDLDLNDSGQFVTFLTYKGTGSKGGANWTAYSPHEGEYNRIDNIQFREDFVRAGRVEGINPTGGLLVLYPGKGAGILVRYQLLDGQAYQEELRHLDYTKTEDQKLFESIFKRKINEPMPDEFFRNPPHKVIEVKEIMERIHVPTEQGLRPKTEFNIAHTKVPIATTPFSTTNAPNVKPTTFIEEQSKSRPWLIWVIIIVIVIGISFLWLIIKSRR